MSITHTQAEKILFALFIKHKGNWNETYGALQNNEDVSQEEVDTIYNTNTHSFITILSDKYPSNLKKTFNPPFVLFYKGDLDVLENSSKLLVIADTYDLPSKETNLKRLTHKLLYELKTTLILQDSDVSLTKYIAGYFVQDKVIVMRSTDKFDLYPNQKLLLAETCFNEGYSTNVETERITSALCDNLLVISTREGQHNSLVNYSLHSGQDVYCVPTEFDSYYGNNELISFGANIIYKQEQLQEICKAGE